MHFKNDDELVNAILKGSESAFQFLLDEYLPRIVSFLMNKFHIIYDEAVDLAVDAIVDGFMKIELYDSRKGKLFAWIGAIAQNAAINKFRRRKSVVTEQLLVDPEDEHYGYFANNASETSPKLQLELQSAVEQLGVDDRKMLELLLEGQSDKEMAERFGIRDDAARQRKRRLLKKLRKILEKSPSFRQNFLKENGRRNCEGECGFQEEDG